MNDETFIRDETRRGNRESLPWKRPSETGPRTGRKTLSGHLAIRLNIVKNNSNVKEKTEYGRNQFQKDRS